MRKLAIILLFAALLGLANGCDFLRWISGRPTSEDISRKRALVREDMERKAAEPSVTDAEPVPAPRDTTAASAAPASEPWRYAIVVGAFRSPENALKMIGKIPSDRYKSIVVEFENGYSAVCLCPTRDREEALSSLKEIKKETFCPEGAWIYVNK